MSMRTLNFVLLALLSFDVAVQGQPFTISDSNPDIERWMYANNAAPCDRPAGATFGTFDPESGVDTRHAQHLVGWYLRPFLAANQGASRYLIKRCRITVTINRGNLFAYDPTQDDYRTYFETNHPNFQPDTDAGRPLELFGAGFRNGYDAETFHQCTPFGSNATGERNGYAAAYSTNGILVDVSNNVGKTNENYPRFEVAPFAVGQATNLAPGTLVPAGTKITFELNLKDPFALGYLQAGLNLGRLRLMLSSLHANTGQFGAPSYPDFATHFNEAVLNPTRLELAGTTVRDSDSDSDGLPDDWELFYFESLAQTSLGDPDADGASNRSEFTAGTDPLESASFLRILTAKRDATGTMTLWFPAAASRRYTLEFTEGFATWTPSPNKPVFDPLTGIALLKDASTGGPKRFYQIRAE